MKSASVTINSGSVGISVFGGGNTFSYSSYPGGNIANVTDGTKITIAGGSMSSVYGGGEASGYPNTANVNGTADITINGGTVHSFVYGGGKADPSSGRATVDGTSVTIGGKTNIGDAYDRGVVINSSSVTNGVASFSMNPDLTGSVSVFLPPHYDMTANPTIATDAVAADLTGIKLVGEDVMDKEAYFDSSVNEIKVRKISSSGGSSNTTTVIQNPDGSTTIVTTNEITGIVTETTQYPDGVKIETVTTPEDGSRSEVTIPGDKGGATVTIPVQDAGPNTVLVILHKDGTQEIVKKSINGEDGLIVHLEESATIKVVDNGKQFNDAPENAWYAEAVAFTSSRELFQGTADKTFSPLADVTRGMIATLLHRLENEPEAGTESFADVLSDAYYARAVAWAAKNGVAKGIGNNRYAPEREVTREELAALMYRFAGTIGLDTTADARHLSRFTDKHQISLFAKEAMAWCAEHGVISGKGINTLAPQDSATRAEAAAILMRFVGLILSQPTT